MSYTKGVWKVGRGGYCVVSQEPVPEVNGSDAVEYYGGHLIGESMSEANAKRIVECVSACDGMENPADDIAKLRQTIQMLTSHLESCANELTFMIDNHNEQSMDDGCWKYDHQTPWEALRLFESMKVK